MARAAHKYMAGQAAGMKAMSGTAWANAATRTMLGVRLGVAEAGDWSMVKTDREPFRIGDRIPDALLHGAEGRPVRLHDLVDDSFVALYFTDVRRRPKIPANSPGLKHLVVSHRDAPLDGGLRDRALFDVGDRFRQLMGCPSDTLVLVRPDDHIAAIASMGRASAQDLYRQVVGRASVGASR
jgi:3-(3-hydroxy-phenyl)propionate hydroxylase